MTPLDRAIIESNCRQVVNAYLVSVDAKDINALLQSFAEDAIWIRPGMAPMKGHADIRAFFEAIHRKQGTASPHGHLTRHLLTTISVTPVDEEHAVGMAYALVYRIPDFDGHLPTAMPEAELLVEYRDTFSVSDLGWQIAEHQASHIFRSSLWRQSLSSAELQRLDLAHPAAT